MTLCVSAIEFSLQPEKFKANVSVCVEVITLLFKSFSTGQSRCPLSPACIFTGIFKSFLKSIFVKQCLHIVF